MKYVFDSGRNLITFTVLLSHMTIIVIIFSVFSKFHIGFPYAHLFIKDNIKH